MPQPKRPGPRLRATLTIRLTADERRLLTEAAQQDSFTISRWTRLALQHALLRRRRDMTAAAVSA